MTNIHEQLRGHRHAKSIELGVDGKPYYKKAFKKDDLIYLKKILCVGLHNCMHKLFFPYKTWHTSSDSGSTRKSGIRAHAQVNHIFGCTKRGLCDCGLGGNLGKISNYTAAFLEYFDQNGIVIDDTEIPICFTEGGIITWIDAMGHYKERPEVALKISLKTGYSTHFHADHGGFAFTNIDTTVPASTANMYRLQSLCEDVILAHEYGISQFKSVTLYAYKKKDENTGEIKYKCKLDEYPQWCLVKSIRTDIYNALCWRVGESK